MTVVIYFEVFPRHPLGVAYGTQIFLTDIRNMCLFSVTSLVFLYVYVIYCHNLGGGGVFT
jgi:hypothetical protein